MMLDMDGRALQAYLNRPLDDLMAELELYDPASRGPADVWNKVAGPVRQRLCDEWEWCEVRQDQRWDDDLALALAVMAALSEPVLHLAVEADLLLMAAIVVKRASMSFVAVCSRRMNSPLKLKRPLRA
jgi:hypothetical protein